MTDTTLTPSRLWKKMTFEQRQRAARAFWEDEEAADDQTQAALLIAQQKKFRPKTVAGLDVDRKARHLASLVSMPGTIAARALIVYHLAEHRAMMAAFLDAVDPAQWSDNDLEGLPGLETPEDQKEELEFARDWFAPLRQVYRDAWRRGQIVVCESQDGPRGP